MKEMIVRGGAAPSEVLFNSLYVYGLKAAGEQDASRVAVCINTALQPEQQLIGLST